MSEYYDQQRADFLRAEEEALDPDRHDPGCKDPGYRYKVTIENRESGEMKVFEADHYLEVVATMVDCLAMDAGVQLYDEEEPND